MDNSIHLSRRAFVRNGSLYLLGAGLSFSHGSDLLADESKRKVRLGLVTDMHYADKAPAGSRHYRETLAKLEEAATQFQKDKPDHVVELGDFIDAADSVEVEKDYLKHINNDFEALTVLDLNEVPTDVQLDNVTVTENLYGGVVGNLTTTDEDQGDSHTYDIDDPRF